MNGKKARACLQTLCNLSELNGEWKDNLPFISKMINGDVELNMAQTQALSFIVDEMVTKPFSWTQVAVFVAFVNGCKDDV